MFFLGGAVVSWLSSKQTVFARSTIKSELIILDTTINKVKWLREFLYDVLLFVTPLPPIFIHCDCNVAIDKCVQQIADVKTNHYMKVRHKSIRKKIKYNVIALNFMRFERNLAD